MAKPVNNAQDKLKEAQLRAIFGDNNPKALLSGLLTRVSIEPFINDERTNNCLEILFSSGVVDRTTPLHAKILVDIFKDLLKLGNKSLVVNKILMSKTYVLVLSEQLNKDFLIELCRTDNPYLKVVLDSEIFVASNFAHALLKESGKFSQQTIDLIKSNENWNSSFKAFLAAVLADDLAQKSQFIKELCLGTHPSLLKHFEAEFRPLVAEAASDEALANMLKYHNSEYVRQLTLAKNVQKMIKDFQGELANKSVESAIAELSGLNGHLLNLVFSGEVGANLLSNITKHIALSKKIIKQLSALGNSFIKILVDHDSDKAILSKVSDFYQDIKGPATAKGEVEKVVKTYSPELLKLALQNPKLSDLLQKTVAEILFHIASKKDLTEEMSIEFAKLVLENLTVANTQTSKELEAYKYNLADLQAEFLAAIKSAFIAGKHDLVDALLHHASVNFYSNELLEFIRPAYNCRHEGEEYKDIAQKLLLVSTSNSAVVGVQMDLQYQCDKAALPTNCTLPASVSASSAQEVGMTSVCAYVPNPSYNTMIPYAAAAATGILAGVGTFFATGGHLTSAVVAGASAAAGAGADAVTHQQVVAGGATFNYRPIKREAQEAATDLLHKGLSVRAGPGTRHTATPGRADADFRDARNDPLAVEIRVGRDNRDLKNARAQLDETAEKLEEANQNNMMLKNKVFTALAGVAASYIGYKGAELFLEQIGVSKQTLKCVSLPESYVKSLANSGKTYQEKGNLVAYDSADLVVSGQCLAEGVCDIAA